MNELKHHGILGMKWGVRRYQNKDGSLKPSAKGRYSDSKSAKENYKKAKENHMKAFKKELGFLGMRLTATKKQRKSFEKDAVDSNNAYLKRREAKYDYKIAKANEKGNTKKVAKLNAKKEINMNAEKADIKVANAALKGIYSQSLGKEILSDLIGGGKGGLAAMEAAGMYSEKGRKVISHIFNEQFLISRARSYAKRKAKNKTLAGWIAGKTR